MRLVVGLPAVLGVLARRWERSRLGWPVSLGCCLGDNRSERGGPRLVEPPVELESRP